MSRKKSDEEFLRFVDTVLIFDQLKGGQNQGPEVIKVDLNEQRALELICEICAEDSIPLYSGREIQRTRHFSIDDRDGYDIIIPTNKGRIGIQIKSSRQEADYFNQLKPNIPCIVVTESRSDERLCIELRAAIWHEYNKL